jgi:plastocyanin
MCMSRTTRLVRWILLAAFLASLLAGSIASSAQDIATPVASPQVVAEVEIVAAGLTNPRGLSWNDRGALFVALAGIGGTAEGFPETSSPPGPFLGGPTGAVARIDDGCPFAIATGLPSYVDIDGGVIGPSAVAVLGGQLYVLGSGGGEVYGNPESTVGVYLVGGDGSTTLIADHSAWLEENPPANAPPEGFPNPGNPFAMLAGPDNLWVVDSLNGLVTSVTADGAETLVADLSAGHPVPTGIALGPNDSLYVGTLTAAPYTEGTAKVVQISAEGEVTDVWTGLTAVTGVAVGPDDALYAAEMSTGNTNEAPFLVPASGRIVRQTGPNSAEPVAEGLSFPVSLALGPDGALYFSMPALGSDDGSGMIGRLDVSGAGASQTVAPACEPISETLAEVAQPTPTQPPILETTSEDGAEPTGNVVDVFLSDFVIDVPAELPAGPTTFSITNNGTLPHNFEIEGQGIDQALQVNLQPGQTGAYSVNLRRGSYVVYCPVGNHRSKGMERTITVS